MSRRILIVAIITLIAVLSIAFFPMRFKNTKPAATNDTVTTIRLSFVGDLMCHSPQFEYAHVAADSFDFFSCFSEVRSIFDKADVLFGNLETVTASKKYSGYPRFNSPYAYLVALQKSGFKFLFTANNHCFDQGENGIIRTLSNLHQLGFATTGSFLSKKDRDSIRIVNCKGIRIAILAYTYGTNGNPVPRGKNYLTNVIDTALMRNDIARAKALKPDILLTYLHFGEEYKRKANEFQRQIATFLKNSGVDLIIASHPHVIEPMEFFKTNNDQFPNGLVAYSLGNFISDQRWRYTDAGMILTLTIEKHSASGILSLCTPEVTPTWVFKGIVNNKRSHRVLPSSDTSRFQFLTSSDKEKMIQSYNDTKELLLKNTTMIHITR